MSTLTSTRTFHSRKRGLIRRLIVVVGLAIVAFFCTMSVTYPNVKRELQDWSNNSLETESISNTEETGDNEPEHFNDGMEETGDNEEEHFNDGMEETEDNEEEHFNDGMEETGDNEEEHLNDGIEETGDNEEEHFDNDEEIANRPVMHTFYEPDPMGYCCEMLESGHQMLLKNWGEAWEAAGWDTKVLTMEDARKHPDFEEVQEKLSSLSIDDYNKKCFFRWLAMSSIEGNENDEKGGGWMSDYDTFPLQLSGEEGERIAEESEGTFSSFSLHVPCLIYASRAEWDRIIHLMLDILPDERKGAPLSDMQLLMLVPIKFPESNMIWKDMVAKTFPYRKTDDEEGLKVDCGACSWRKAVHISHRAVMDSYKAGLYPKIDRKLGIMNGRGEAARVLMQDFHEQCVAKDE